MEIRITHLTDNKPLMNYSASAMELGQDAGHVTWENAMRDADSLLYAQLETPEALQEARDYIRGFGAWTEADVATWSNTELRALVLQFIAGDLREYLQALRKGPEEFASWNENHGGRIYEGDNGELYFYLGE